jgi:hypothetical protein
MMDLACALCNIVYALHPSPHLSVAKPMFNLPCWIWLRPCQYIFFPTPCLRVKFAYNCGLWEAGNMHSRAGHHALVWAGQHALWGGNHAWGLGEGGGVAEGSLVPLPRIRFTVKLKHIRKYQNILWCPRWISGRSSIVCAQSCVCKCKYMDCASLLLSTWTLKIFAQWPNSWK